MIQKIRYLKYYAKVLLNNWTVNKDSYAQHGEDLLIESLSPDGIKSYIDIGANDGVLFSNTYKFAKNGASGLCIEPSSTAFRKLQLNHLFHPKVKCIKAAVSSKNEFSSPSNVQLFLDVLKIELTDSKDQYLIGSRKSKFPYSFDFPRQ